MFTDRLSVWSVHYLWWGFSAGYIVTQVGGGATSEFMSESLNHTLGFESFKNETSLASVGRCCEVSILHWLDLERRWLSKTTGRYYQYCV